MFGSFGFKRIKHMFELWRALARWRDELRTINPDKTHMRLPQHRVGQKGRPAGLSSCFLRQLRVGTQLCTYQRTSCSSCSGCCPRHCTSSATLWAVTECDPQDCSTGGAPEKRRDGKFLTFEAVRSDLHSRSAHQLSLNGCYTSVQHGRVLQFASRLQLEET